MRKPRLSSRRCQNRVARALFAGLRKHRSMGRKMRLIERQKKVSGVGAQPNGAAYYRYRLKDQTTTGLTAQEIHEIGLMRLRVCARKWNRSKIRSDLTVTYSLFNHVRDSEWNYYPNTDEGRQAYIDDATSAINRIKAELPNYFGLLPQADLIVKRWSLFASATAQPNTTIPAHRMARALEFTTRIYPT